MACFQIWSVFGLSLFSIWLGLKLLIYRYSFFVPILQLSTVAWSVACAVATLSIVNQLIIYASLFLLLVGFKLFYSYLLKHS